MKNNKLAELICAIENYCYNEKMIAKLQQQIDVLKRNQSKDLSDIENKNQDIFREEDER